MPEEPAVHKVIARLKALANPRNVEGMARYGINPANTLGVSIPEIRKIAREVGRDHDLAAALWASGIHEARLLACFIDSPKSVTVEQMEAWAGEFDSWDICDQCCSNLFDRTPFAYQKAGDWSRRGEEFVKRAGFVLMAALAVHDKKAPDEAFLAFLPLIEKGADDNRNFVKKAVNWALRQIGKRDRALNRAALDAAGRIREMRFPSAKWIASDAIRELQSEAVQARLKGERNPTSVTRRLHAIE